MANGLTIETEVLLNNGIRMPILGFGTYRLSTGAETREAILHALRTGYRLIDTASIYENEKDIGEAIRASEIPREKIFLTTKLWITDHGYDAALTACRRSLRALGMDYIDLYLIHWPEGGKRKETWRAMVRLLEKGLCRAIGVSNYSINHIKEILLDSPVIPAVNQIEVNPFHHEKDIISFCSKHRIQVQAYSPLAKGSRLHDPLLLAVAAKYGKTPAQLCIRWALQKKTAALPKSSHAKRIAENARVFDFSIAPVDMETLDSLSRAPEI